MTPKIKIPTIAKGEPSSLGKFDNTYNPFGEFNPKWLVPDDKPLDEQIAASLRSYKRLEKHHRETELHEVRDISVYTKYGVTRNGKRPNRL